MSERSRISEIDEADLAALVDGRLAPARRDELEARLAEEPTLAEALERQRRGLTAIAAAAGSVSAPLALRQRIEEMQRGAAAPARKRRLRLPSLRIGLPVAGLAAAAAAAVIVVLVTGGGPSVESMVAAATRPPVAAVTLDPSQPKLLQENVEGVPFPNYEEKFDWSAVGTRTDTIDGRDTRTVHYELDGNDVAYTIVAGGQLPGPSGARPTEREGIELRSFTEDGRNVVTWRREGRTCVMSAEGVPTETLLELAAWRGEGASASESRMTSADGGRHPVAPAVAGGS